MSHLNDEAGAALTPGTLVGIYRIESPLGEGGMGTVYRAQDTKLNRPVAIKFLSDELADVAARHRFQREAQMASSLNHPHILTVYDVGDFEGRQYLVTEFVDGGTLKDWSKAEKRTWRQIVELLTGVADGLAAAHQAGILHRDIKPANILVAKNGYAKLADFGLAKLAQDRQSDDTVTLTKHRTQRGAIVGTIAYMSPEQASGKQMDARSDIFSFGIVLYELLAGRRPFSGASELELLKTIIHGSPQPLGEEVTPPIRSVVEKALEKDPAERYQSMQEMVVDLKRLVRQSDGLSAATKPPAKRLWKWAAAAVFSSAVLAGVVLLWLNRERPPVGPNQWVQLTTFPDSVSQPALSPDGRMMTFVRGPYTFFGQGQIYVKILPDGAPVQLTHDTLDKMSPAFSPDGSRIAYTTVDDQFRWDVWTVPVLGGEPQRWLANAAALVWNGPRQVLFSEMKKSPHMAIVAAAENRIGQHDVYVPASDRSMAHRSYPSPDGKWALVVEMDQTGRFTPCRLVPLDSTSPGRQVGPEEGACTFAAWSPDGKWMLFSSSKGGSFHNWRQRFDGGQPQQITSGPTEEEGIALTPDGRSFTTAVALKQSSVWVHDSKGERQVSLEGFSFEPKFTPDGKKVCYLILKGDSGDQVGASELWIADLQTGRAEALLPGLEVLNYDLSQDGLWVALQVRDHDGKSRLWVSPLDRRSAPRQIPNVEGQQPRFGQGNEIFFRAVEGNSGFAYRVQPDGSGLRKAIEEPIYGMLAVSPNGQQILVWARLPGTTEDVGSLAFPLDGGPPMVFRTSRIEHFTWTQDTKWLFVSYASSGKTYIIPSPRGASLPNGTEGRLTEEEVGKLAVRTIDAGDAVPGATADAYAFSRATVQRNLYRVPLP